MLSLRGHHLICLHFFRGEGYSQEFISQLELTLKKAEGGEQIRVVSGADEVCAICPYSNDGLCAFAEGAEQEIQEMDDTALSLLSLTKGDTVQWPAMKSKIPVLFRVWSEKYCVGCSWRQTCKKNTFFRQLVDEKTLR